MTPSQLAFPYLVNWGYPERFHRAASTDEAVITGIAASPGVGRGDRPGRPHRRRVRRGPRRRHPRLPDDQPGLGRAVHARSPGSSRTRAGRRRTRPSSPREFGIPAVVGTSDATRRIATGDRIRIDGGAGRGRRPGARRRRRACRGSGRGAGQRDRALTAGDAMAVERPLARERPDRPGQGAPARRTSCRGRLPAGVADRRDARWPGSWAPARRPVREALRALEALGVVEITPFRGARVRRPSRREIVEAYAVRVDAGGAGRAVGRAAADATPTSTALDRAARRRCGRGGRR